MLVIVYLTIHGEYKPPGGQVLMSAGWLAGVGCSQRTVELEKTTIGGMRHNWGMGSEMGGDLPNERVAWLYEDDGLAAVLIEVV